jgi:hypothetical protein
MFELSKMHGNVVANKSYPHPQSLPRREREGKARQALLPPGEGLGWGREVVANDGNINKRVMSRYH